MKEVYELLREDEPYQELRKSQAKRLEETIAKHPRIKGEAVKIRKRQDKALKAITAWRNRGGIQMPGLYPRLDQNRAFRNDPFSDLILTAQRICACVDTQTITDVSGTDSSELFTPQADSWSTTDFSPSQNSAEHQMQLRMQTLEEKYELIGESEVLFQFLFTPSETATYCIEPILFAALRRIMHANAPATADAEITLSATVRVVANPTSGPQVLAESSQGLLAEELSVAPDELIEPPVLESDGEGLFTTATLNANVTVTIEVRFMLAAQMVVLQPNPPFPWDFAVLGITGPFDGSYDPMCSVPQVHVSKRVCKTGKFDGSLLGRWLDDLLHQRDPNAGPFPPRPFR